MLIKDIKNNFHICTSCKGKKYEWKESHDCWGRDDSYKVSCYNCGGSGFTMNRELKKQIESALGL